MTEAFDYFFNLIEQQAARQRLPTCDCGRRPVVVEDLVGPCFWVGCKVITTPTGTIGCGTGFFAETEAEAMQKWQKDADNKQ